MLRRSVFLFLVSLLFAATSFSQSVLKTFILVPGEGASSTQTRIVRNEARQEWLVTTGCCETLDYLGGILVKSDGRFSNRKGLLSGGAFSSHHYDYDIAYGSVDHTYLIVYRDQDETLLQSQLFTEKLARRGRPVPIHRGSISGNVDVGITYNPIDNTFLVVWLDPREVKGSRRTITHPSMLSVVLNSKGRPISQIQETTAASGSFDGLTISRNKAKNRSLVTVAEGSKLLGYHFDSNGELLHTTPTILQRVSLVYPGSSSFSRDGSGFATWVRTFPNGSFKLRKLSAEGKTSSAPKTISPVQSLTTFLYDSLHNQFFSAWLSQNFDLLGGLHNPLTGLLKGTPFLIAHFSPEVIGGPGAELGSSFASYDAHAGNVLIVWHQFQLSNGLRSMRAALVKLN